MQWLVHDGAPDQDLIIRFMERLVARAIRPIALIVRDQPCFSTPTFIEWSLRNKHRIVFNLLPASFNIAVAEQEER
ncbi:MAG: hypothetical protein IPL52_18125 [Flavobacteriales bacterium]|nr:hypothetical protein [Flavobacteriales bacterium]